MVSVDELDFRNRNQIERAHVEQRALGLRVEGADRFQGVAEEVEAAPAGRARPGTGRGCRRARHIRRARARSRSGCSRCAPARPRSSPSARHVPGATDSACAATTSRARHALHDGVDRGQHDQRLVAALSGATAAPAWSGAAPGCRRAATPGRRAGSPRPETASPARSGAKNSSARASCCMRGPSRQTTARLTAGRFWPRRDGARQIGDNEPFGAFRRHWRSSQRAAGRKQRGGRFDRRLHASWSTARKALMRSNSAAAYSGSSSLSPISAA